MLRIKEPSPESNVLDYLRSEPFQVWSVFMKLDFSFQVCLYGEAMWLPKKNSTGKQAAVSFCAAFRSHEKLMFL